MDARITILDGGIGRELHRIGAPFRQPEWSALAITEAPELIARAHASFIASGATVITTNSYAIVPFHIGEQRFAREAHALAASVGSIARAAASRIQGVRVAGSLPPLFGSYRPDLFDEPRAPEILTPLISGLSPFVDIWLAETQGSIREVQAVRAALGDDPRPLWISFTLDDESTACPLLRSGESVTKAAQAAAALGASALLFNCSIPEIMEPAIVAASSAFASMEAHIDLGAYANAFPASTKDGAANEGLDEFRADVTSERYAAFAKTWASAGATIIGGCCGIGPEHIARVRRVLFASV